MIRSAKQNWVWHSTEESRAVGQISVLAVAETLICVAIYWALMLLFGVTFHHWLILIATPLVLFRSEQSVALGVRWFDTYIHSRKKMKLLSVKGISLFVASAVVCGLTGWFLASNWLVGVTGWVWSTRNMAIGWLILNLAIAVSVGGLEGLTRGLVRQRDAAGALDGAATARPTVRLGFAAAMAGAAAGAVAAEAAIVGRAAAVAAPAAAGAAALAAVVAIAIVVPLAKARTAIGWRSVVPSLVAFGAGSVFGVWLRALVIRLAATTRFLPHGLIQFPNNWRFSMAISDVFHPPELIPGDKQFRRYYT